jgi:hypothetical protein
VCIIGDLFTENAPQLTIDAAVGATTNATSGSPESKRHATVAVFPKLQRQLRYRACEYLLNVRDTLVETGLELFPPQYTIGTDAFLLAFHVADRQSFTSLVILRERVLDCGGHVVLIMVVGLTTADGEQDRLVSRDEAEKLARDWGVDYFEVTGKKGHTTDDVLDAALRMIVDRERRDEC